MTPDEIDVTLTAWAMGWEVPTGTEVMMMSDALVDVGRGQEAQIMRYYYRFGVSRGPRPRIRRIRRPDIIPAGITLLFRGDPRGRTATLRSTE